jgi:hypothetical protein
MGYQQIVAAIRTAAIAANEDGTFIHGRKSDGSLEYNEPFPQIHLYPFTTQPQEGNRNIVLASIVMAFWQQDAPDTTNERREEIIAEMDVLSNEFISQLELDLNPLEIATIKKEPQYRTLSATLSGYAITFELRIFESPC